MALNPFLRPRALSPLPLAGIGALFVFKYAQRTTPLAWLAATLYAVAFLALAWALLPSLQRRLPFRTRQFVAWGLAGMVVLAGLVIIYGTSEVSRVGRLTAMQEWLAALFAGRFPYDVPSFPSGFPVLFLSALPFWWLGNLGLLEVTGLLLFLWTALQLDRAWEMDAWIPLALLAFLPTCAYELLTRSELFFNASLLLVVLLVGEHLLRGGTGVGRLVMVSLLFGLVLSTRTIAGLVLVMYGAYRFRSDVPRGIACAALTALVFLLSLLPFYLWNPALFVEQGPFAMQLRYLPGWSMPLVMLGAAFLGWRAATFRSLVTGIGMLLFGVVFLAFLLKAAETGWGMVLEIHGFDISYFILCIPFLLVTSVPGPGRLASTSP